MDGETDTIDILRAVFRLEAERTLLVARLGRVAGAEQALHDVDERLAAALSALNTRGVAYPLHAIARRYRLGQEDYLLLQLALLPRHGSEVVLATTDALGDRAETIRLSHGLALIAEGLDDWERARAEVMALPVFRESLVKLVEVEGEDDPALAPSLALLELLGLE